MQPDVAKCATPSCCNHTDALLAYLRVFVLRGAQIGHDIWSQKFGYRPSLGHIVLADEFLIGCVHAICVGGTKDAGARFRCDWNVLRHLQQAYESGQVLPRLLELQRVVNDELGVFSALPSEEKLRHLNDTDANLWSSCKARFSYGFQVGLICTDAEADGTDFAFTIQRITRQSIKIEDPQLQVWRDNSGLTPGDHPGDTIYANVTAVRDIGTGERVDMTGDFFLGTNEV